MLHLLHLSFHIYHLQYFPNYCTLLFIYLFYDHTSICGCLNQTYGLGFSYFKTCCNEV